MKNLTFDSCFLVLTCAEYWTSWTHF